jgi:hypothetical protein
MSTVGSQPSLTSEFTVILQSCAKHYLYLYSLHILTYHLPVYVWEEQIQVSIFHLNFPLNQSVPSRSGVENGKDGKGLHLACHSTVFYKITFTCVTIHWPSLPSPWASMRESTYSGRRPVNQQVSFCRSDVDSGTNMANLLTDNRLWLLASNEKIPY